MLELLLILLVVLPIAWLVSEFWPDRRFLRIVLGIIAIGATSFFAFAATSLLTTIRYNLSYGDATKNLIESSIAEMEAGHGDRVLEVWRGMNMRYSPTYEDPPVKYEELVEATVSQLKGDAVTKEGKQPAERSENRTP